MVDYELRAPLMTKDVPPARAGIRKLGPGDAGVLDRVAAGTEHDNAAARRVYESAGADSAPFILYSWNFNH